MMLAAITIDEADPPFGESFKGVDLPGIDDVVDDAGNHFDVLHRWSVRSPPISLGRIETIANSRSGDRGYDLLSANDRTRVVREIDVESGVHVLV